MAPVPTTRPFSCRIVSSSCRERGRLTSAGHGSHNRGTSSSYIVPCKPRLPKRCVCRLLQLFKQPSWKFLGHSTASEVPLLFFAGTLLLIKKQIRWTTRHSTRIPVVLGVLPFGRTPYNKRINNPARSPSILLAALTRYPRHLEWHSSRPLLPGSSKQQQAVQSNGLLNCCVAVLGIDFGFRT